MHATSGDASVVFLGLMDPEPGSEADNARRLTEMAAGFSTTILVKNASEGIDTAVENNPDRAGTGQVTAKVTTKGDRVYVTIIDNGCGLPKEDRDRLIEDIAGFAMAGLARHETTDPKGRKA